MEVKYDKSAVLDYIANFRILQGLMKRDMDESLNKYKTCKQEYSRIYTECEEESRRAYNRVMSAESEIQMADMMMEHAMASMSDSDDVDSQPDYDIINCAQEMRRQAEADLVVAQADYARAQDNICKLNVVMEKYGPALEAESKVVNDSYTECSIVGSKAGEALEQYVGVMDKAYSALYEGSSLQSIACGARDTASEDSGNEVASRRMNKGGAGSQFLGGTFVGSSSDSSFSVGDQGIIGSIMGAEDGLDETQIASEHKQSSVGPFLAGTATDGVVSYMIAGQKREFPNSKVGLNQAYKAAIKAKDKIAAGEILRKFNNYGNNQAERYENTNESIKTEMLKHVAASQTTNWSDVEYGNLSDKIQIADRNSGILEWSGEKGNSIRRPKDSSSELFQQLNNWGVEGIPYVNGDVDFSKVSKYEIEFADVEKLYIELGKTIKFGDLMTVNAMKSRSEFNGIIRTKWQSIAKQQIIDRIRSDEQFAKDFSVKTGVNTDSIENASNLSDELRRNGLTLHETADCKKIQFVPTQIHDAFKHAGGTAEMLERLINGDIHNKINT